MSQENVDLAQSSMQAWINRDATSDLIHDDFEFHPAVTGSLEGTSVYRGREGWAQYMQDVDQAWSTFSFEIEESRDLDERVLFLGRFRAVGRESGVDVDLPSGILITTTGGQILRIQGFRTRTEALEAVGLSG